MIVNASVDLKKRKNLITAGESENQGSNIEIGVAFPQKSGNRYIK